MQYLILIGILFQVLMLTRCPSGLGMEAALGAQSGLIPYKEYQMHGGPVPVLLLMGLSKIPALVQLSVFYGLFTLSTAVCVYLLAKSRMRKIYAVISALLFLVLNQIMEGNAHHTETVMTAFGVWGMYFFERRRYGLMTGSLLLSLLSKQTGLLYLASLYMYLPKKGYRVFGLVTAGVIGLLAVVAAHFGALDSAVNQLGGWTFTHAATDPWPWSAKISLWPRFLIPLLGVLLLIKQPVKRHWEILIGLFVLHYLVLPSMYYMLGAMPLLCVLVMENLAKNKKLAVVTGLVGGLVATGWTLSHNPVKRTYGVMDNYYVAEKLTKMNIQQPVWTNANTIYYVMNWPVPNNNFLDQTEIIADKLDFDTPELNKIKTCIYFVRNPAEKSPKGGPWVTYKLDRGMYKEMRIWRRYE